MLASVQGLGAVDTGLGGGLQSLSGGRADMSDTCSRAMLAATLRGDGGVAMGGLGVSGGLVGDLGREVPGGMGAFDSASQVGLMEQRGRRENDA